MRLWIVPARLLGLLSLALLASGAWLFRHQIIRAVKPEVARVGESLGLGIGVGRASTDGLIRARDKVDSLNGWQADSVVLRAAEMASLIADGLPREARARLDSIGAVLGEGRVTISARLETTRIPPDALGPLAGALDTWEPVSAAGPVSMASPGTAEWRVDALTLRGFTLPPETSRHLTEKSLPGAPGGVIPVTLPRGVRDLRVRPGGVALYGGETR
jgi:hypothetical protein